MARNRKHLAVLASNIGVKHAPTFCGNTDGIAVGHKETTCKKCMDEFDKYIAWLEDH